MAFEWKYKDHSYAPSAHCKAYPFFATVMDCDGDLFTWEVRKHKECIAYGSLDMSESMTHDDENHFRLGEEKCEAVMREKITEHITKLETNLNELRAHLAA